MARLGRRPDYKEASRLRDLLEGFSGKPTLSLSLARIQFDRDFGDVLVIPGQGKWKEGWTTQKVTFPDGRVRIDPLRSYEYIGPSDDQLAKQRQRIEAVIQRAPNDPEVLLLRASRASKEKPEVAGGLLARAEAAGIDEIQPLSTRILAWKVRKTPTEQDKLIAYLKRTYNDRVTRTALRGNAELASLSGLKP